MIDIRLGDCLEVMNGIPDGSVDAVVTDPPYGQSNESYDRGVDPAVWRECYRVAKADACLISFAGSPTYHRIASDIEAAGWKVRQMWGWIYRDGMITSAWPKLGFDRLAPAMDPICFATKGRHLLSLEREGKEWKVEGNRTNGLSERSKGLCATSGKGHWPRSVIASEGIDGFQYFALSRGGGVSRITRQTDHPNEKPLSLMEWLVSKVGRIVLDPYMGTATTGEACFNTDRSFIGIEQHPPYFKIASDRLAAAESARASLLFA